MRRRSQSGVTLMELLIAVTLLSLLTVGVMMAMRIGLDAMNKGNDRVLSNRRITGAHRIIEQQISGLMITMANCRLGPDAPVIPRPFFQGEPESMRFVSSHSLQEGARGFPQVLEYQVIPGERGEGVRLIVNEHLYFGPDAAGRFCTGPAPGGLGTAFVPIQAGPRSFVLADQLAFCRFSYLTPVTPQGGPEWVPVWVLPQFPRAIRIEMEPLEPVPAKVPMLSITMPVRVNRLPGLLYEN